VGLCTRLCAVNENLLCLLRGKARPGRIKSCLTLVVAEDTGGGGMMGGAGACPEAGVRTADPHWCAWLCAALLVCPAVLI
jgi:hypothetical protein